MHRVGWGWAAKASLGLVLLSGWGCGGTSDGGPNVLAVWGALNGSCNAPDTDCDGVDDDCDGRIDESFQTRCMFGSIALSCVNGQPVSENCNDSNVCTVDRCSTNGCSHVARSCDDGNPCTADSCDPVLGCRSVPVAGLACSDGDE